MALHWHFFLGILLFGRPSLAELLLEQTFVALFAGSSVSFADLQWHFCGQFNLLAFLRAVRFTSEDSFLHSVRVPVSV